MDQQLEHPRRSLLSLDVQLPLAVAAQDVWQALKAPTLDAVGGSPPVGDLDESVDRKALIRLLHQAGIGAGQQVIARLSRTGVGQHISFCAVVRTWVFKELPAGGKAGGQAGERRDPTDLTGSIQRHPDAICVSDGECAIDGLVRTRLPKFEINVRVRTMAWPVILSRRSRRLRGRGRGILALVSAVPNAPLVEMAS